MPSPRESKLYIAYRTNPGKSQQMAIDFPEKESPTLEIAPVMNSMKLVIPLHLIVLVNSHQR